MSDKTKPKSRSKSRSKEHNDKSWKKDERSKIQIPTKELKEKKLKTTGKIAAKKQEDNESIDKKVF
ncbi:Uncharacterized protein BM_BM9854 [Brugia malayi]|uniref:Uncharacterized protein n=1 Tax=Brugia malayi TaxID=6279 RepID=A0A4E9F4L0_BRUMA|nr:Uncharacterized protein BM_BM9854 [Brugia malayi]VIO90189.1 Uncharacterized protein BM_BM9854 [Brugia malayi]